MTERFVKRPKPTTPPDRIVVGWCPACGEVSAAAVPSETHLIRGRCPQCVRDVDLLVLRYELAQRREP